ncbi:MAG: MBOAT family O-acyltransferase [Leptospirales bacterium]
MIFFNEYFVLALLAAPVIYWKFVPEKYRNLFIIFFGFIGLSFVQLNFSIFLMLIVVFVFYAARFMQRSHKGRVLTLIIIVLTLLLAGFKYFKVFYLAIFEAETDFSKSYLVPLGLSYLIFKLIAYVVDIFREEIKESSLQGLLAFIFFIPSFPAGPIERYQHFISGRRNSFDSTFYLAGLKRLTIGYFKKVVLVNFLLTYIVNTKLSGILDTDQGALYGSFIALSFLVGSLVYAYIDLSAYADIAIGYGQLYGYQICENMNYPLFAQNLSEYWQRWHMSLSQWCRNNVYFPMLGSTRNNNISLYASFLVMGLWHYASLNWILWGLWHASGIIIYSKLNRFRKKKKIKKLLPKKIGYAVGMAITVIYSGLGFAFITQKTTSEALKLLGKVFGL